MIKKTEGIVRTVENGRARFHLGLLASYYIHEKDRSKSRSEDIVLQYELDMKLLLSFLPPGFEDPFFRDLIFSFLLKRGGFVRRWAETFLNIWEKKSMHSIHFTKLNLRMFGCLTQRQICKLGICLLALFCKKKKDIKKGQVIPNEFTQVSLLYLSNSIMYSQTPLIQTLEAPQKVSAGIKRVMLLKSKKPLLL